MTLLTPTEAEALVRRHAVLLPSESVRLSALAGRVLRQTVVAERDQPPFDRVAMDGVALHSTAVAQGRREFHVQAVQGAGAPPLTLHDTSSCIEVMTGAMLPAGCDCAIPVERLTVHEGYASIQTGFAVTAWLNVHRRGSDGQPGQVLLTNGTRLNGAHIAAIAAAGLAEVVVARTPRIQVFSTGDELVEPGQPIADWQVRSSNGYAMRATLQEQGFERISLAHLVDEPRSMRDRLQESLEQHDVLVLSGGVSMGRFDYVPEALVALGVQQIFHKIAQRPGLPMWFGTRQDGKLVFGLPGNPVSALTCLVRYVLPALRASLGERPRPQRYITLSEDFQLKPALTYFLPVTLQDTGQGFLTAAPHPTKGSGDFFALLETDGFVELAPGPRTVSRGEVLALYEW